MESPVRLRDREGVSGYNNNSGSAGRRNKETAR